MDLISRQAVKDIIRSGMISIDTDTDKEYVCELIDAIPCAGTVESVDYMAKILMWIYRTYKADLKEKFKDIIKEAKGFVTDLIIFDAIYKEMQKEMPLPWNAYCCCFNGGEEI